MKTLILRRYRGRSPISVSVDDDDYDIVSQHPWYLSYLGYPTRKINGKRISLHRFIMNPPPGKVVDHINGDTLDNRKQNLRICTIRQNIINSKVPKNNTSGYTGVSFRKNRNAYRAYIMVNRKQICLGSFKKIEDAVLARREAEEKYFGEFAYSGR